MSSNTLVNEKKNIFFSMALKDFNLDFFSDLREQNTEIEFQSIKGNKICNKKSVNTFTLNSRESLRLV